MFSFPLSWIARAAAACAAALTLASCGGGVSANPSPIVDSPTLTILPATATMYPGLPTTFVLSGGTGAYIVTSDNQAVIPIAGGVTGRSVTLVPNPVATDTTVTLTLRDTGAALPVTATVTVRPGTLNNDITITPTSTQAASCSPAICSGGDASVTVTLSQGGTPLKAREVRFEVVSGAFNFIVASAGAGGELLATAISTTTDETGTARARIRVTPSAANQTALLKVTDTASGASRQATFAIAQYNGNTPAFFTLPSSITLFGPSTIACSTGSAEVAVFGGTPPYSISSPSTAFTVRVDGFLAPPALVTSNGGKFTITFTSAGQCIENLPIAVTDAAGLTVTVLVTNKLGTAAPPITLVPNSLSLQCGASTTLAVVGGSEPFAAGSTSGLLLVLPPAGRVVTMNATTRGVYPNTGPNNAYPGRVMVSVTDGTNQAQAQVDVTCPFPP